MERHTDDMTVSPDGRTILYTQLDEEASDRCWWRISAEHDAASWAFEDRSSLVGKWRPTPALSQSKSYGVRQD
jgi:hypothetical protein